MTTSNLFIDQFEEITNGKHSNCRFCNTSIHKNQSVCPYCDMPVHANYIEAEPRADLHESDRFLPVRELQQLHMLDLIRLLAFTRQNQSTGYTTLREAYSAGIDPLSEDMLLVRNDYTQDTCAKEILKTIIKDRMGYVPTRLTLAQIQEIAKKMGYVIYPRNNGDRVYHVQKKETEKKDANKK